MSGGALTGTQSLSFDASDPGGPGVYRVSETLDGASVYDGTPDGNAGACSSNSSTPSGGMAFLSAQPCRQEVSVDLPSVDTTTLKDGSHRLKVSVVDAAGNTATVLDQTITTGNTTPPILPPGSPGDSPTPPGSPAAAPVPAAARCLQAPRLDFHVTPLGRGRLRFAGSLSSPGCSLGSPKMRPLVIVEVKNGRHWQAVGPTARVSPAGGFKTTYGGGGRGRGSVGGTFSFRAVAPSTSQFSRVISTTRRAHVR